MQRAQVGHMQFFVGSESVRSYKPKLFLWIFLWYLWLLQILQALLPFFSSILQA